VGRAMTKIIRMKHISKNFIILNLGGTKNLDELLKK
jgi:hypothetical protein